MDYILISACKYWRDKCAEQIDPPIWRFDRLTGCVTSYWLHTLCNLDKIRTMSSNGCPITIIPCCTHCAGPASIPYKSP